MPSGQVPAVGNVRRLAMAITLVLAVAAGLAAVSAAVSGPGEPLSATTTSAGASGPAPVRLDLGPLGKAAALDRCATTAFVAGRPGRLRVRYGMLQRTPTDPAGSFVLRNHTGEHLFCDMFGRQRPSVRPMPTTSLPRPAVHVTNSVHEWTCQEVLFRANAWLRVQDPVRSARIRYWVDGVAGPWFVSRRQGRFVHLQSWLAGAGVAEGAAIAMQTQVLDGARRVLAVPGLPSGPRRLSRSCGVVIG